MRKIRLTGGWKLRFLRRQCFALILAIVLGMMPLFVYGEGGAVVLAQQAQSSKPRLVVFLVANQFSYDYLTRFWDKFSQNGLRYLVTEGANFTNCRYPQATGATAVGQAIIATGSYPWSNGIVGNSWYDRHKNRMVTAIIAEENLRPVTIGASGTSAHSLVGTTIGDQLKLAFAGSSKVCTVALNDQSALLLAGKFGDNAFCWDTHNGMFVNAGQPGKELPTWASSFNEQHYADGYVGKIEGASISNESFYTSFARTPWADQMVADFAKAIIEHEALGQHTSPDFLGINFASTENITSANSQERENAIVEFDLTIGNFLKFLDQKVGINNCLVVFTADRGACASPELFHESGETIESKSFAAQLNTLISARLGKDDWVEAFEPPNLYLNLGTIDRAKFRQPDVEALAAKMAHSISGTGEVYTAFQFFMNQLPSGPFTEAIRKSYYWGRSGELYVMPKPGFTFTSNGTNSGTLYTYDSQVPLILCGALTQSGHFRFAVSPADIAPTVASILEITPPAICEGRVLNESLSQPYGPPHPHKLAAVDVQAGVK